MVGESFDGGLKQEIKTPSPKNRIKMTDLHNSQNEPTHDEMESLFVNNEKLDLIEAHLNKFNPIKTMKMERMEIRHSAILAWLLDPSETHGLADRFLKAFLGEALRGHSDQQPNALGISQADLRDAEVRCEWRNIDIFILDRTNEWAFIIENKFNSNLSSGQLKKYFQVVEHVFKREIPNLKVRGVFLTLQDEDPDDRRYVPIKYDNICSTLPAFIEQESYVLSPEVTVFLRHYVDVLEEATGMSDERKTMEQLARELYRSHKKALDFVTTHGASSDFASAARTIVGESPERGDFIPIADDEFVFDSLSNSRLSILPADWVKIFERETLNDKLFAGCERWWAGYPLISWIEIITGKDGIKGKLKIIAEVGPISEHELRKHMIEEIRAIDSSKISFQKDATKAGRQYSRFFKQNTVAVTDIQDPEKIETKIRELLNKFRMEYQEVSKVLSRIVERLDGEQ